MSLNDGKSLAGKIVVVAGGGRGGGRGVALALGDAGATVYVVSRTKRAVEETAAEVTARGGTGIPIQADLSDENQAAGVFSRIDRLHLLANSIWSSDFMPVWGSKFWELDSALWRDTQATVSACWFTSVYAARDVELRRPDCPCHRQPSTRPACRPRPGAP